MTIPDLTGVILAGGESSRFGDGDKALSTLDGWPLLVHVVKAVCEATNNPPIVAAGDHQRAEQYAGYLPDGVRYAADDSAFEGPLAGLFGSLEAVETDWIFCCGCDMPGLSASAVKWLAIQGDAETEAVAVRSSDGTHESLHALYRVDAVRSAQPNISSTAGPRALLDELTVQDVPPVVAPDDVDLAVSRANVNTEEDLRDLEETL